MKHQIYQTSSTPLATALASLGVPFAEDECGRPIPMLLVFDPATLRRHGYKGWNPIAAARDAHAKKKAGQIHYQFQRTPELEIIVEAFEKTWQQLNDPASYVPPVVEVDLPTAAKFAAQLMKNRADLAAAWQTAPALVVVLGEFSSSKKEDGSTVMVGSAKAVSLNASPELCSRIGV
jgi:hypothetical protein